MEAAEQGEVERTLRMVGGDGEYSYATNSWHQVSFDIIQT